jgi:hypothetical protein
MQLVLTEMTEGEGKITFKHQNSSLIKTIIALRSVQST